MRKLRISEMYSEMLTENEAGGWINPRLEPIKNPYFSDNFMIKLDDFKDIHESINVSIYNVSKRHDSTFIIHCKQDFY